MRTLLTRAVLVVLVVAAQSRGRDVAGQPWNCFAVVVGKDCTTGGKVLYGHNEDSGSHHPFYVWNVAGAKHAEGERVTLHRGGTVPQVARTNGFLWMQMPGLSYSDTYVNEHGVAVATNRAPSRIEEAELEEGGIDFMLRRLVAERAATAREGMELVGGLIERFGYADAGRVMVVADATEAWIVCMMRGKHWAAVRVPDDRAIVIANSYPIHAFDPADEANVRCSSGLVEYARARGWVEGEFDFAEVFGEPDARQSPANHRRQWRGIAILMGEEPPEGWRQPAFFKPKRKVAPLDLMRVLRDHYEGTAYAPAEGANPHATEERTICAASTSFSTVIEPGGRVWMAAGRPCSSAYVRLDRGVPEGCSVGAAADAFRRHFEGDGADRPPAPALQVFTEVCDLAEERPSEVMPRIRASRPDEDAPVESVLDAWRGLRDSLR